MELAIIAVLLIIAYIIWNALKRIGSLRRDMRDRQSAQDRNWEIFSRRLSDIGELKKQFFSATGQLTQDVQNELWLPVHEKCAQACGFFLIPDFARAMARLNDVYNEAVAIMKQRGIEPIAQVNITA